MTNGELLNLLEKLGYTVNVVIHSDYNEFQCSQGITRFTFDRMATGFVLDPEDGMTLQEVVQLLDRMVTGEDANAKASLHHHILCSQCDMAVLRRSLLSKYGSLYMEYRAIDEGITSSQIYLCPQCQTVLSFETTKQVHDTSVAL